jgi:threonine aldolase
MPVDTNILIFKLKNEMNDREFLELLKARGILAIGFGLQTIRMVTHLDFTDEKLALAKKILKTI